MDDHGGIKRSKPYQTKSCLLLSLNEDAWVKMQMFSKSSVFVSLCSKESEHRGTYMFLCSLLWKTVS